MTNGTARSLYPSFDHGNALGFQESDARREELVGDTALIEKWARRGTSHHFAGRPNLVELAHRALALGSPNAKAYSLKRISDVSDDDIASVVARVPEGFLSATSRRFVTSLLTLNRERVRRGE